MASIPQKINDTTENIGARRITEYVKMDETDNDINLESIPPAFGAIYIDGALQGLRLGRPAAETLRLEESDRRLEAGGSAFT